MSFDAPNLQGNYSLLKKRFLRPAYRALTMAGILLAFIWYLYENANKFIGLLKFSAMDLSMLFLFSLLFSISNSIQNTLLYRGIGLDFSYKDGFLITSASTLANQLPIPGGILSRGYYLRTRHGLSYAKFVGSMVSALFFALLINGLLGLLVLLTWHVFKIAQAPLALIIAFTLMSLSFLILWIPLEKIRLPKEISQWLAYLVEGWSVIRKNNLLFFELLGLQVSLAFLLSFRYMLAFRMLSQKINFGQALLFANASILTQIVSIAPGGLGVRETIVASVASVVGFDPAVSVVSVGLDRLVMTAIIVLTGWASIMILAKK